MNTLRKLGLFVVMVGALALSFVGQVLAAAPLLGKPLGVVLAVTNDVASLLALHEATIPRASSAVRGWAWAVLFLAGGTALGLNTWHALSAGTLPTAAAVVIGVVPVVLAWLLSHLVALVASQQRETATETVPENSPTAAQPTLEEPAKPATDELIDRAEALEREALENTGRGVSYRQAMRELGVRFEAAKSAVLAARERINATETTTETVSVA